MLNYLISLVKYDDSFHPNRFQLNWTKKAMAAAEKCIECARSRLCAQYAQALSIRLQFHFNLS